MMKLKNNHTIVNFSNSILKHFSAPTWHESIQEIDQALEGHDKVVVMLFDGLGKYVIDKHLRVRGYLRSHYLATIDATFPPTTVASTTGFLTGKFPIETGWLSWSQYFDKYQCDIEVFKNTRSSDGTLVRDKNDSILFEQCPYENIFHQIEKANPSVKAFDIFPEKVKGNGGTTSLKQSRGIINQILKDNDKTFIYFYWTLPDGDIHRYGVNHIIVHFTIKRIQRFIKAVVKKNRDTIFFSFADHGLINVKYLDICEHEDMHALLSRPLSFEKRVVNFFVQPDKRDEFASLFNKYYGQHFELMDRESVFKDELFGKGQPSPHSYQFIGDFIAIAKDVYCLYASSEITPDKFVAHKGHHAGGTKEEMEIDISVYNR
ncbi:MAG TPA: alkaline phosphatase family protein [Bacilli bacterium]|nr:alkaline phosphatase family protein [Bacilli bacterium]